ncbi:MAG: AbrB/MazE/SpoVT family DNA-binding domain-containing protein [Candidatus Woesearchaeota archaeon]
MGVETIKMSSKGQIVIPQTIRDALSAIEGTLFAVVHSGEAIILKKISTPSQEELFGELGNIAKKQNVIKKRGMGI